MFFKKWCCKKFHKFHRKTSVLESLFNEVAGQTPIFVEHLPTTAFALHLHHSCLLSMVTSSSSSLLLLLISPMFLFGSNSKGFKEFKSGI